jgi:hypothetical protein
MNTAFNLLVSVQETSATSDGASLTSNTYRLDASGVGGVGDDLVAHLSVDGGGDNYYELDGLGFSRIHAVAVKVRGGQVVLSPRSGFPSDIPDFAPSSLTMVAGDWWGWSSQTGEDVSGGKSFRLNAGVDGSWTMIIVGKE